VDPQRKRIIHGTMKERTVVTYSLASDRMSSAEVAFVLSFLLQLILKRDSPWELLGRSPLIFLANNPP